MQQNALPHTLSDAALYAACKKIGVQIRRWSGKFEPLLLEVWKRGIYKKYFSTIHEFAYKIAGFNREKVDKILRLLRKLEDKPVMKAAFESGELTYAKIEDIVFVATREDEAEWTGKAKTMPRIQLQFEVRKTRTNRFGVATGGNSQADGNTAGNISGASSVESVENGGCGESGYGGVESDMRDISFKIDIETERELRALQNKLEKERGEKLTFGEVMKILIKNEHEKLIEKAEKKRTIAYCPDCAKKRAGGVAERSEIIRAVPVEIRNIVLARQNYHCARNGFCTHPPTELHHIDGWALTKSHNPERLEYLCKRHHAEIHATDPRVQKYRLFG